ncbi:MAG: hypothetical protein U0228_38100 [Myxococcaceae bacterium]
MHLAMEVRRLAALLDERLEDRLGDWSLRGDDVVVFARVAVGATVRASEPSVRRLFERGLITARAVGNGVSWRLTGQGQRVWPVIERVVSAAEAELPLTVAQRAALERCFGEISNA